MGSLMGKRAVAIVWLVALLLVSGGSAVAIAAGEEVVPRADRPSPQMTLVPADPSHHISPDLTDVCADIPCVMIETR